MQLVFITLHSLIYPCDNTGLSHLFNVWGFFQGFKSVLLKYNFYPIKCTPVKSFVVPSLPPILTPDDHWATFCRYRLIVL